MSPDPKPALKLLAKSRGCSVEQARQFCSKVRRYCQDENPADSEILGALRKLGSQGSLPSYHDVARRIEEPGSGGAGPGKKGRSGAEIRRFEGPSSHQGFIDWTDRNGGDGFVLNLRGGDKSPVLHVANCPTLKPDPKKEKLATTSAKLCSTSRNVLRREARNLAEGRLQWCQHCDI